MTTDHSMRVEITNDDILVDAILLAPLLDVSAAHVPDLMRKQAIRSVCERGVDVHEGQYRLTFFYRNRRVRLNVDSTGQVIQRTTLNFGDRGLPPQPDQFAS